MDFDAIRAREAAHFLPVVKRLPVALVEGRGSRVRDVDRPGVRRPDGGLGGHLHRPLPPGARRAIARAGRPPDADDEHLLHAAAARPLSTGSPSSRRPRSRARSSPTRAPRRSRARSSSRTARPAGRCTCRHTSAFHGRTLGALQVIGTPKHRDPYAPLLPEQILVPFDDLAAARRAVDATWPRSSSSRCRARAASTCRRPGYLRGLREICDATGALLVFDEVQTGVGRTGRWFACEHEGVVPDVMTLGKGLGGGFPVAAFLTTEESRARSRSATTAPRSAAIRSRVRRRTRRCA